MGESTSTTQESPEDLARREAERRAAEIAAAEASANPADGILGFFAGIFDLVKKLFTAIFGAFFDKTSEYSEIDPAQAQQTGWGEHGRERATAFIESIGNDKLRALAAEYKDKPLKNISPFEVTAQITSNLGKRPVNVGSHNHAGIDAVPVDGDDGKTRIVNTMPGVVVRSETQRNNKGEVDGFGNWVEVACIDGTRRRYAHLAAKGVPVGTVLRQGDLIGIMGNTGVGTGAHLHYEWRDANGNVLEPEINGKTYHRDDRSYILSKIAPALAVNSGSFASLVSPDGHPKLPVTDGGKPKPLSFASGSRVQGVTVTH